MSTCPAWGSEAGLGQSPERLGPGSCRCLVIHSAHGMEIRPNWLLLGDPCSRSAGSRGLKKQSHVSLALSKPDTQQPPCQGGDPASDVTHSPLSFLWFLCSRKSRMGLGLYHHFPTAYVDFNFLTIAQHFCIFSIFRTCGALDTRHRTVSRSPALLPPRCADTTPSHSGSPAASREAAWNQKEAQRPAWPLAVVCHLF